MTDTEIANDFLTHLIPGTFVVPAMVTVITILQAKYGFSYITVA